MLHFDRSPSSSPARKRQRMSSPTYDGLVDDISDEHLQAFDIIEAKLSQASSSQDFAPSKLNPLSTSRPGPSYDADCPFFTTAASTLKRKVEVNDDWNDREDDEDPFSDSAQLAEKEKLYDSFLNSTSIEGLPMFGSAKSFATATAAPILDLPLFQTAKSVSTDMPLPTFSKASNKENQSLLMPSKDALLKAQAKMAMWAKDWEVPVDEEPADEPETHEVPFIPPPLTPAASVPQTPKPALAPAATFSAPVLQPFSTPSTTSQSRTLPTASQAKPFRVPTFKAPTATPGPSTTPFKIPSRSNYTSTPLRPLQSTPLRTRPQAQIPPTTPNLFSTPGISRLASTSNSATIPTSTPSLFQSANRVPTSTPRSLGMSRKSRTTFKTPFKKDVGLGVQHLMKHSMLSQGASPQRQAPPASPLASRFKPLSSSIARSPAPSRILQTPTYPRSKGKEPMVSRKPLPSLLSDKAFGPPKQSLATCGLRPQEYTAEELEEMGLNVTELSQITPATALHYGFFNASSSPTSTPSASSSTAPKPRLNHEAAYDELIRRGCSLATREWVTNHWCLILWKLAGLAAFDPITESEAGETGKKRWCWGEAMRQLTNRYQKEINEGHRPALRRIVAEDSPACNPMVLCVSGITWIDSERGSYPELEVTDGWYRLQAHIDAPMVRAVQKGHLKVGRKIEVVGARLNSEKKDPQEILDAYSSVKLVLSSNSTHLAPWHAKLGFSKERFISTLRSLSGDGGAVGCVDIEILKVHPIAHLEFVTDPTTGVQRREGPRNSADEMKIADAWMKQREKAATKLRWEHEKKSERYLDYCQRLEGRAGAYRGSADDGPPDSVDELYDDLEDHATALRAIAKASPAEAHWLIKTIHQNVSSEHERTASEIEQELATLCPPRNVRNFRVLVVKDARTPLRKESHRIAQLTVWDVATLSLSEGGELGSFKEGQRYMVSNLIPTQSAAWMRDEPGAEIYMATRKNTQWMRMKSKD